MSKIRHVTQLELDQFGQLLANADDATSPQPLSADEIRQRSAAARVALDENGEMPTWADTYHRLINAGWPWRIAAFVAWSSMPKGKRWPKTQEELAIDVLGLTSDRAVATWRKKHPEIDQLIADLQADEMLEARGDVLHALKASASTVDYKHAPDRRMYFEMTGDLVSQKVAALMIKNEVPGGRLSRQNLKKFKYDELLALAGDLMGLDSDEESGPDQPAEDEARE